MDTVCDQAHAVGPVSVNGAGSSGGLQEGGSSPPLQGPAEATNQLLVSALVESVRRQVEQEVRLSALRHESETRLGTLLREQQASLEALHRENAELWKANESLRQVNQTLATSNDALDQARARLDIILRSDGWAMLRRYYALRRFLVPPGSWRHRLLRGLWNLALAPFSRRHASEVKRALGRENLSQAPSASPAVASPAQQPTPEPTADARASADAPAPAACVRQRTCPSPRAFRILYVVGCPGDSARYRATNVAEALGRAGVETAVVAEHEAPAHLDSLSGFDVIVLFRAGYSPNVRQVVEVARAQSIPLVFDVDDLVFDPAVVPFVDGIRMLKDGSVEDYLRGVMLYRATWQECDGYTAPTASLLGRLTEQGKPGYLIKNALSSAWLANAEHARLERAERPGDGFVRIGYFPGTVTHQKDFGAVYRALVRVLRERPDVKFVVGAGLVLSEFPMLAELGAQVERRPFVDWSLTGPAEIARIDINLAPLEVGNPFCEAKSELKYFEAAAVKVPTVASPTDPFVRAIRHGQNGFLANTEEEWYTCLSLLAGDPELRAAIGENACEHALTCYGPEQTVKEAVTAYRQLIQTHRQRQRIPEASLTVAFVIPEPTAGSGGHKDIFLIANQLVRLGHQVVIVNCERNRFPTAEAMHDYIKAHFVEPAFACSVQPAPPCCDALVATHWTTAELVHKYRHRAHRAFYFVQDYEPYFAPMGEDYVRALRTYTLGLKCITLGPWLSSVLGDWHGSDCAAIPFWIEREIYFPQKRRSNDLIVFLARPEMPRRCFGMGVRALELFHRNNPDTQIVLYGSAATANHSIPFPHTDLGVLRKPELAALYSRAALGIVFSTTNPSFVPYEMMACKCPVLDLRVDPKFDLLKYNSPDNVFLADPNPEDIARAVESALLDDERRLAVGRNGFTFASQFPDVKDACNSFEAILRREFVEGEGTGGEILPLQHNSPRKRLAG
jgi:glycosyltransferase involved in cell wall biosynthesis